MLNKNVFLGVLEGAIRVTTAIVFAYMADDAINTMTKNWYTDKKVKEIN